MALESSDHVRMAMLQEIYELGLLAAGDVWPTPAMALGRLFGAGLPWPEKVPVTQAITIARWMADTCRESGGAVLSTTVSGGLRVALSGLRTARAP